LDDLVLRCLLTHEGVNKLSPQLGGSFLGDTSLPPGYRRWNTTTKSMENRALPYVLSLVQW
jgi:hypothetical protein